LAICSGAGRSLRSSSGPGQFDRRRGASLPIRDLSGKERTLEEFKGKVVLLDFWATCCAPCMTEMPLLETLSKELREKDVVVLGIDVREEKDIVSEFIGKGKYTFPILLTTDDEVTDRYKVTAYPTLVVVNPAGRIADYIIGSKR
jgi:thiol-disulfide isomerase/thioredoxin